ncbi:c-type cytochrome [Ruegeria faecimaris]|uniref:c-type cytochrome n=1 Tax=Ruegeria faecimaris TaxID=686389 RepID=UPI0024910060|nr:c-type cytochrome [Ruegeria faecimaris]
MLKSLSHVFLPVFGGTALVLAVAVSFANRNYGHSKIEILETRIGQVEAHAAVAQENAEAESKRAAELEIKVEEIQAAAAERVANGANLTTTAPFREGSLGLGRSALKEEIAAWDVDVLPDGRGLPVGSGDVWTGEEVFVARCASCHGEFAEGADNWPVLAGGFDTLADEDPVKTVGSYWPHLSTAWDYISRSMPFGEAGTLTADETYAIVAYILYSNDLVDDDFELNNENFAEFKMYNMDGFVVDVRPETEYTEWRKEPCMENCKAETAVTMRSVFLVETPAEGGSNSVMNNASPDELPTFSAEGPSFIPTAAPKPDEEAAAIPAAQETEVTDEVTELAAAGEKVFKKCKSCHQIGEGAKHSTGPALNGVIGANAGSVEGFKYSKAMQASAEAGLVWTDEEMAAFLAKPKEYMKGTRMSFAGLRKQDDIEALIIYLKTFGS